MPWLSASGCSTCRPWACALLCKLQLYWSGWHCNQPEAGKASQRFSLAHALHVLSAYVKIHCAIASRPQVHQSKAETGGRWDCLVGQPEQSGHQGGLCSHNLQAAAVGMTMFNCQATMLSCTGPNGHARL